MKKGYWACSTSLVGHKSVMGPFPTWSEALIWLIDNRSIREWNNRVCLFATGIFELDVEYFKSYGY